MTDELVDVAVLGGGPGGATAATFCAMDGRSVVLIDRARFPRYQIGESLLPATIHGICAMLGVSKEIAEAGFVRKRGGTFRWGANTEPWTFAFGVSEALDTPTSHAYQVERSKFDNILLQNAKRKGVDVREECTFVAPIEERGRIVGIRYSDGAGVEHTVRARYVIDASGHQGALSHKAGERVYSEFFKNVALFGYFEGGGRMAAPNDGNILCAAFEDGWFWYIPLSDTLTSVGAVVSVDRADAIRDGKEEAFAAFIERCPIVRDHLKHAKRVTEGPYGELRIRKDYSYTNTRFWAPGLVLVGDAACFIDPVFSSGVHLATFGGLLAARSINSCLEGTVDENEAFGEYERRYRREYGNFYRFLVAFYDMAQDESSYFWAARKATGIQAGASEAFLQLVAGVSSSGEPLFESSDQFLEATQDVSAIFERAAAKRQPDSGDVDIFNPEHDPGAFMGELVHEASGLQRLAEDGRSEDLALFDAGLAPSANGLRWRPVAETTATGDGLFDAMEEGSL